MKKVLSIISCALLLLAPSGAFSQDYELQAIQKDCVNIRHFHGSFVGTQGTTPDDAILSQFMFNADKTIYSYNSNAIVFPITSGTFTPQIGTWETSGKKHIIATVIDAAANTVGGTDVTLFQYARNTFRFKIINEDKLLLERVVVTFFNLNQNPLVDEGVVLQDISPNTILNRVKVIKRDL